MPIPTKPRFRGKVTYAPNSQGIAVPVAGARIRVWDDDPGSDDLLVDTTTSSSGHFNKVATKTWQDTKTITMPWGGRATVPDVTDLPVFIVQIDDPATDKTMKGPFAYVGDGIDVPLIVPWTAPDALTFPATVLTGVMVFQELMKINGTSISTANLPDLVWETVKNLAEAKEKITIDFSPALGLTAPIPFKGKKVDYEALRVQVCTLLGIDPNSDALQVNPAVETLIAVCVIVFIIMVASPIAVGGAAFMVILGVSILLAVALGYTVSVERTDTASGGSTNSVPIPLFDLKVVLTPPA